MTDFLIIFLGACLVNNLVLDHLLGIAPLAATARRFDIAMGFAVFMAAALTVCTAMTGLFETLLLQPLQLGHLRPLLYALLVVLTAALGGQLLQWRRPQWMPQFRLFLPLLLMNTALYGAALFSQQHGHGPLSALAFGAGCGAGFILVTALFTAMNERLLTADVPRPFRGPAVVLLCLAFLAMGFSGFTGLVHR